MVSQQYAHLNLCSFQGGVWLFHKLQPIDIASPGVSRITFGSDLLVFLLKGGSVYEIKVWESQTET